MENTISMQQFLNEIIPKITPMSFENIKGNKIFEVLRDRKIFIEHEGFKNYPSQKVQDKGLFTYEKRFIDKDNKWYIKPLLTQIGSEWLVKKLVQANIIELTKENVEWIKCSSIDWIIDNADNKSYLIQYKNYKGEWFTFTEGCEIKTLINIKRNNRECRYCTIKK